MRYRKRVYVGKRGTMQKYSKLYVCRFIIYSCEYESKTYRVSLSLRKEEINYLFPRDFVENKHRVSVKKLNLCRMLFETRISFNFTLHYSNRNLLKEICVVY